jgi:hypothetical protein
MDAADARLLLAMLLQRGDAMLRPAARYMLLIYATCAFAIVATLEYLYVVAACRRRVHTSRCLAHLGPPSMPVLLLKSTKVLRYGVNNTEYLRHTRTCCTAALQLLQLNPNGWVTQPGVPQRPGYGAAKTRLFRHGAAVAVLPGHSC